MENQEYATVKRDIDSFFSLIKSNISEDSSQRFLGYRVFYSPLIVNPTILFIGINPGAGQICEYSEPEERFEYLDYDYDLAKDTKDVFRKMGFYDVLENSAVKINYYYMITRSEPEIYQFTNQMEDELGRQFYIKSAEWSKSMIDLIKPKIIICEGKRAYEKVTELYPGEWKEIKYESCWLYENLDNNIVVVGYKRRYSNIVNKEELASVLAPLLEG